MIFMYRKVNQQHHENVTRSINQMVVDAIHVTALKKGILDKTRIMRKLKKKQSEESSCQARVRSVATTFDNIRHPWHRIRFPNHLQMLTSDIGAKFRRLCFLIQFNLKTMIVTFHLQGLSRRKETMSRFFLGMQRYV